mgnify:CR=1 FL=1
MLPAELRFRRGGSSSSFFFPSCSSCPSWLSIYKDINTDSPKTNGFLTENVVFFATEDTKSTKKKKKKKRKKYGFDTCLPHVDFAPLPQYLCHSFLYCPLSSALEGAGHPLPSFSFVLFVSFVVKYSPGGYSYRLGKKPVPMHHDTLQSKTVPVMAQHLPRPVIPFSEGVVHRLTSFFLRALRVLRG